jgi:hypothetical protein
MAEYQTMLQAVAATMNDPILTEEEKIGMRVDFIIRELDELCGLANAPETVDLIAPERVGIGQIITRAQLIASFLMSRQPTGLRMVRHG